MPTTIPIRIYEILQDRLGRDEAKEIEATVDAITREKKIEAKDELGKELVTRAYFEERIAHLETKLESKLRLYFLILLFAMFILNPNAIDLIAKLLGVIK
jgi:hypothetical protein